MSFARTVTSRPILVSVASLFPLLLGLLAIPSLPVREYPSIDPAVVNVTTSWSGADAEAVENQVTEVLEQSLGGIDGIRTMTSQSREGRSTIAVEFDLGVDLERAASDVRDRVSRVLRNLPDDADAPSVAKADANSSPVVMVALTGPAREPIELGALAVTLQERLQTIQGVSEVRIWGEKKRAMRVRIDPLRLSAAGLSLPDLKAALAAQNVELPAGSLEGRDVSTTLRARTGLSTPAEFAAVIVSGSGGRTTRLGDVARVEEGAENERTLMRIDGTPGQGLAVIAQPGANQIAISDEVDRRLEGLRDLVPPDVRLEKVYDATKFVRRALSEVEETVAIAFVLVVLVIFAFLREWRSTLIPVLTIPVSLLGVFGLVWALGYSINVLTLLGVVLSIGLVVDDAIVVLENIYAHVERGKTPREAAVAGLEEIAGAVVSTTLSLAAVFAPLLFLQGFTGRLFREFGVVVGGSVLISGFVALTLSAMLSSRLLRPHGGGGGGRLHRLTEPFFEGMGRLYARVLDPFLRRPWLGVAVLAAAFATIAACWKTLPRELVPTEDRSALQINLTAHEGATFAYTDALVARLGDSIAAWVPETEHVQTVTSLNSAGGTNSGLGRIYLPPAEDRSRSQDSIARFLQSALPKLGGARISVVQEQSIRSGGRQALPVQMIVKGPDLASLREKLQELEAAARQDPVFSTVDVDLRFTKPQLDLALDRDRLRDLGITPEAVGSALQVSFGTALLGYYLHEGRQFEILAEVDSSSSPEALDRVGVRAADGHLVPLSNLVRPRETLVPPQRLRTDRQASFTLSAGLAPGATLGQGVERMRELARGILDHRFDVAWTGQSRDFLESSSSLGMVFVAALTAVFLLLAAQFESLWAPFVILLTVPLALAGALLGLRLLGHSLNLFSQIGLVMLVGLVTKNGILIVEFAMQRRERGESRLEAVRGAALDRLRPILMTSLATVLGILPIALALGAGAESRVPMGVAVVWGMLGALPLTLLAVPAVALLVLPRKDPTP